MKNLFVLTFCLVSLQIFAQIENYPPGYTNFVDDLVNHTSGTKANNYYPFGGVFTPQGTIRALIIYAGFVDPDYPSGSRNGGSTFYKKICKQ